ncbi:MAG: hypothetical protein CL675_08245 [Bdellovibrionaceae bacterium]|nr:hypothetical protein [Pseudobdellovibrionaceae bacterium]
MKLILTLSLFVVFGNHAFAKAPCASKGKDLVIMIDQKGVKKCSKEDLQLKAGKIEDEQSLPKKRTQKSVMIDQIGI